MRVGRAAPAKLYIRSDRVEYLALLCPVHISALPPLCLFHPPFRRPTLATAARCSFLRLRFAGFLSRPSKLRLAFTIRVRSSAFRRTRGLLFSEADKRILPSKRVLRTHYTQYATAEKRIELVNAILYGRLRNFTGE